MENKIPQFLISPEKTKHPYLLFFFYTLLFLSPLIANPGFWNHDEWQIYDAIHKYGFSHFIKTYGSLHHTQYFGEPMRPIGFIVEGVMSYFMKSYPFISHFFSVLVHFINTLLLYFLILKFNGNKKIAQLSSLIFIINPLATVAIGATSCLMDQLYILFVLLTLFFSNKFINQFKNQYSCLLFISIFSLFAILSKETAFVLPALMLLNFHNFNASKIKKHLYVLFASLLPIICILVYRFDSIINSLEHTNSGAYAPSLTNILKNILVYFGFPFSIPTAEPLMFFSSTLWVLLSCLIHLLFLFCIFRSLRFKGLFVYIFGYFIFLFPVISLPGTGGHYLYGSSIFLSIFFAIIFLKENNFFYKTLNKVFLVILFLHMILIQYHIYYVGNCMSRILVSTESIHQSIQGLDVIYFGSNNDGPDWMLRRTFTGRVDNKDYIVKFDPLVSEKNLPKNAFLLRVNKECIVYK
jgi:hypothetical protein